MEASMYEDGVCLNSASRENIAQMKRKFTLDLSSRGTKKIATAVTSATTLLTPSDLAKFTMATPEVENMMQESITGFVFPRTPTTLPTSSAEITTLPIPMSSFSQDSKDIPTIVLSNVSDPPQYTQLESSHHQQHSSLSSDEGSSLIMAPQIKEEPQLVPSIEGSPPLSPINMESQERIKLERKRLRNRIAASKCRRRKLEKINKLEDKVEILKGENSDLQGVVNKLKAQVCQLKQEVMDHVNSGCEIPFLTNH